MNSYLRIFKIVCMLVLASGGSSAVYATNGHQLSAIGAYQQGMGGAVTAAPYDASTSITNPAGMAMIGTRADFSFEAFMPKRKTGFKGTWAAQSGSPLYMVPAVGWNAAVNDRNDVFFGGGMYGVSGMGVDYDTVSAPYLEKYGWTDPKAHIYSQYQYWKMAPTLAWKWGGFAMGVAFNLGYQALGFENVYTGSVVSGATTTPVKMGIDLSETQGAYGYGGSIGFIYKPASAFSIGASYISRQNFSPFTWRLSENDIVVSGPTATSTISNKNGLYTMDMDYPEQAAIGIAVRLGRPVLWTADVKWINYDRKYKVVKIKGDFTEGVKEVPLRFGWDDVKVYATALQFDITPKFALRFGYNHSNSPMRHNDVDNNLAFPAIVKDRVSGGFTYRFGRNWEMTMAYMRSYKNELKSDLGTNTTIRIEESAGDLELSYRF